MPAQPRLGAEAEAEARAEMAGWDDAALIAKAAKEAGFADGIAAQQLLAERRLAADAKRQAELIAELRKPEWKRPSLWLAAVAAVTGCIAVYPQVQQWRGTPPAASVAPSPPPAAAAQPASQTGTAPQTR